MKTHDVLSRLMLSDPACAFESVSSTGGGTLDTPGSTLRQCICHAILFLALALPLHGQTNYTIDWFTVDGGGSTITGGVYALGSTIGQPDAGGPMTNGQYSVMGGFWALPEAVQTEGAPMLMIVPDTPGNAKISWSPDTGTNWVLQESLSLSSANWTNSLSGWTNSIVVPATLPTRLYRLHKP